MKRNKVLKIVVGSVAGVALGGALIYCNFVYKDLAPSLYVGDTAPDFAVDTYEVVDGQFQAGGEQFRLSEQKKLTVINFWDTWCGPCKAELPHFSELQKNYEEYLDVIALVPVGSASDVEYVEDFLNGIESNETAGWSDFAFTFGYYYKNSNNIFYNYGFEVSPAWPSTAMVDENGKVVFLRTGGMTYEELENAVQPFLPDGTGNAPSTPVEPTVTVEKNWWKENALGVTLLVVSAAALCGAIVVSTVTTVKDKKKKIK